MTRLRTILDKARRAVLRKGAHLQDADDLVQEAFLKVKAYEQTHEARSHEALIITAAVNLTFDQSRRRKIAPFVEAPEGYPDARDEAPLADEVLRTQERLNRMAEGLNRLPEKTRRILLSRRLEGKPFKDIAEAEGMTVAAVEKQVARATLELVRWMDGW